MNERAKQRRCERLCGVLVLVAVFAALALAGNGHEQEQEAAKGPTPKERWEIVHRVPISAGDYEMLRLHGWDRDPAGHKTIIINQSGKPELVEWARR